MSSEAAKRAAARRQAILSSRGDRLAKLTSSARGEDGAALFRHVTPSPVGGSSPHGLKDFVGEETTNMPAPTALPAHLSEQSRTPSPAADPSVWSQEQQQEFMRALMGGVPPPSGGDAAGAAPPSSDPFANLLAQFAAGAGGEPGAMPPNMGGMGGLGGMMGMGMPPFAGGGPPQAQQTPPKPKTLFQKLSPLLHLLSTVLLVVYFVLYAEPARYDDGAQAVIPIQGRWQRWAALATRPSDVFGVQVVPIFWSFVTLQLALHSMRIFTAPEPAAPTGFFSMALSMVPQPYNTMIVQGLKYVKMGGMLMDDLAVLVFTLGIVVWLAGWFS
ncbi:hypothetical protein BOTBODRAFT_29704 [Botryobasidium botryosum FD-172 SS1]|uniref:GET complex subunit GET2 n=1 Tax=Botryobasidium botryosum (strain FD-172 SS1) TaxID=930990 RepID=A0A067MP33_BOTB1|nr:hypothetical protein BOTBODRAFT_29704 [Botryobasidium botryosum FD-172 SS1]